MLDLLYSFVEALEQSIAVAGTRLVPAKPYTHTHSFLFPVFQEKNESARSMLLGFRCECGGIQNAS